MDYENFRQGFNKPTKFTAENYGTKISVEIDHSDLDIDEVMDAFQTLIIGMGYHQDSFKRWVIDRANEYNETDAEDLKEKLEAWKFDMDNDIVLRHQYENREELEDEFFGKYDIDETGAYHTEPDWDEERMDIIGQNGNEGLHYDYNATLDQDEERYRASKEDEDEFDDYGQRIHPTFEWGDEPEDEEDLFDGDEWETNENLKAANERYKSEVKKMNAKQKRQSKK